MSEKQQDNKQNKHLIFNKFPVDKEFIRKHHEKFRSHHSYRGYFFSRWALKCIRIFVSSISYNFAYKLGGFLGRLLYLLGVRKKVAMTNLDIVYKDTKTKKEKEQIYKECLINVGRYAVNYFRLPFLPASFWDNHCELENAEALLNAFNKKKGVILIGAHIGMWDLACGKLGTLGYPVVLIGKNVKNPAVHACVCETRVRMNFASLKNRGTLKQILEELRAGGGIVMTVDQDMRAHKGVYLNWLGHTAYSVVSTAFVAKRTGSVVIPIAMYQLSPTKFKLRVGEEIPWIECEEGEKELQINAQNHSDIVQKWIMEAPELWFWLHKRYKTQPNGTNPYKK